MSTIDRVLAFVKVVASELAGDSSEPVFNVVAMAGFDLDDDGRALDGGDGDENAEQAPEQYGYSALGIIGRPLPPEGDVFAEACAIRIDGGLNPVGWRDMRLYRAVNPGGSGGTPAAGQLMFAGYGGAFLSHSMTAAAVGSRKGNISTWYVPFAFDSNDIPQKAHVISIDPTTGNSSISLVHADGVFFTLTEDAGGGAPGIAWAIDDATFGRITPGEVVIQAAKITLKGNVYVGAQPEVGLPLLAGPASPPCPSLFLSPV